MRKRNQRYADKMDLPAREAGNAVFDGKYVLFLPEDVSVAEVLSPALMDALIAANPQVDILNKVVVWMRRGMVSDAVLLKQPLNRAPMWHRWLKKA